MILLIVWDNVLKKYLPKLSKAFNEEKEKMNDHKGMQAAFKILLNPWFRIIIVLIGCIIYLATSLQNASNLMALLGMFTFIAISTLLSAHPANVTLCSFHILKSIVYLFIYLFIYL